MGRNAMDVIRGSRPAGLMALWCGRVLLSLIQAADGSVGECALNALNQTFRSSTVVLDRVRFELGLCLEKSFVGTRLFEHLDDFCGEAAAAGPGLLARASDALQCGGWCGAAGLQAYARSTAPVVVISQREFSSAPADSRFPPQLRSLANPAWSALCKLCDNNFLPRKQ